MKTLAHKTLKDEFDKLTLQLEKMRNYTDTLSHKIKETKGKQIKFKNERNSTNRDQRNVNNETLLTPEDHVQNDEEKLESKLKDTDSNVEIQDAKLEAEEKMLKPPESNVDTQFDVAPEIKASFVNQRVLGEPENIGDKNLVRREELESAASNEGEEGGDAFSENMGHGSASVAAGGLDRRYVNSAPEESAVDAAKRDNDFHGMIDSIVIG